MQAVWALYSVILVVSLWVRMDKEDKVLREHFGEEWDAYAARTRYRVVPFLY